MYPNVKSEQSRKNLTEKDPAFILGTDRKTLHKCVP